MAKLDIDRFCDDLESCYGKGNTYGTPECLTLSLLQAGYRQVRCAGLLVAAAKAQGASISNGTNTIWRKQLAESGYITDGKPSNPYPHKVNGLKSSQLERGMLVFKWSPTGCSNPTHEKDGLGNYQHIGVVLQAKPLRIIHCSSVYDGIAIDTTINTWCAWGWHKAMNRNITVVQPTEQIIEKVGDGMFVVQAKSTRNVRSGIGTDHSIVGTVRRGEKITVVEEADGWYHVFDGILNGWSDKTGYIVTKDTPTIAEPSAESPAEHDGEYVPMSEYTKLVQKFNALVDRVEEL